MFDFFFHSSVNFFPPGVYSRHIEASTGSVSSLVVYGCANNCNGGGYCNSGVCICYPSGGFYGEYCQFRNCTPACENGGICTAYNVCNCSNTGYGGAYCTGKTLSKHIGIL